MKLLIVEDQPKTGQYLRQGLSEAGFNTELVADGSTGQQLALSGNLRLHMLWAVGGGYQIDGKVQILMGSRAQSSHFALNQGHRLAHHTHNRKTTAMRHCRSQSTARHTAHAREHDGVTAPQQIQHRGMQGSGAKGGGASHGNTS